MAAQLQEQAALRLDINSREDLLRAIVIMQQSEDGRHRVPLLRALYTGRIQYFEALRSRSGQTKRFLAIASKPAVILIGDDDDAPTGPAGWSVAERALGWANYVILHGAGGEAEHYEAAVRLAEQFGRVAIIESTSARLDEWKAATRRWARRAYGVLVVECPGKPHPAPSPLRVLR